ncbi:uncharacterized protein MONBRDRAFT_37807 [Monosiga brevicollis MX1]|uniref:Pre-mRNA processing factor 4 (PRP4)-like domain-containing protein n=1 Tax=Monosiga brevicollis TaxID=81824 RepID=A9V3J2_MONBE|nr:uncharacterized protein MONBRDRAFT_37807 [Monosiga brevicollis MX1]EDQ87922.1 predicted protein [Monosiga brevicollis MX1]|eukprot:XP_001747455.1 hypothetical protein [Monosiga brevicollis MX1]
MAEEGIELRRFSFVPGGQEYYCATDVARFMGRPLWQFYQLHPSLYRRQATAVERQLLQYWDVAHAPLVTLLLAEEVDVLRAEDDGAPLLRQPRPVKSRKIMLGSTPVLLTQSAHAPMIPPRAPGTERAVKGSSNPLRQYYRKPHGLASEADALEEQLVPIKLTLDKEGYKFRDQFTWNINEPHITPALFAELLCQDAELPSRFAGTFAHSIQQQLDAFRQTQMMDVSTRSALVRVEVCFLVPRPDLIRSSFRVGDADVAPTASSHCPVMPVTHTNAIWLKVQYASSLLSDSFEWQHGAGSPEDFAQSLIIELGLPSDYGPLLAHAIHEQLLADKKVRPRTPFSTPSMSLLVPGPTQSDKAFERIQRQLATEQERRQAASDPQNEVATSTKAKPDERMDLTNEEQAELAEKNEAVAALERKRKVCSLETFAPLPPLPRLLNFITFYSIFTIGQPSFPINSPLIAIITNAAPQARALNVPAADMDVKKMLRSFGEPICLFGENPGDRRERLRDLILERGPATETEKQAETEATPQGNKDIWYHEGPAELEVARRFLADYSLPRASERLKAARLRLAKTDREEVATKQRTLARLQEFIAQASEVGDTRPLSHCRFSPDGKSLAISSWSGLVKLWSVPDCKLQKTLKGHEERVSAVEWHPRSGLDQQPGAINLASCDMNGAVHLWSMEKDTPLQTLDGHDMRVARARFHPSGRFLGTTCFDESWRLFDLEQNVEVLHQEGHSMPVYDIAFHPDGSLAGTTSLDCYGRIWDLRTGKNILVLTGHRQQVLSIDFSPNGFHVATASDDHTVRIWDLRKSTCVYTMPAHTNLISQLRYHPSGNFFVTSSYDKTAKVWQAPECTPVRTLKGHESRIMSIDVSPDASLIATSSYDRSFKLWGAE